MHNIIKTCFSYHRPTECKQWSWQRERPPVASISPRFRSSVWWTWASPSSLSPVNGKQPPYWLKWYLSLHWFLLALSLFISPDLFLKYFGRIYLELFFFLQKVFAPVYWSLTKCCLLNILRTHCRTNIKSKKKKWPLSQCKSSWVKSPCMMIYDVDANIWESLYIKLGTLVTPLKYMAPIGLEVIWTKDRSHIIFNIGKYCLFSF